MELCMGTPELRAEIVFCGVYTCVGVYHDVGQILGSEIRIPRLELSHRRFLKNKIVLVSQ